MARLRNCCLTDAAGACGVKAVLMFSQLLYSRLVTWYSGTHVEY